MKKEKEYENACDRIVKIFMELTEVIATIRDDFDNERIQDSQLTMTIIDNSLKMVSNNASSFLGYKKRSKKEWSLEKYIQYVRDSLHSFFREFDNPFLSSARWTPRIEELLNKLSHESRLLDNLSKTENADEN